MCSCDTDFDPVELHETNNLKSDGTVKCGECRKMVEEGVLFEAHICLHEGEPEFYAMCGKCQWLRDKATEIARKKGDCFCWGFGSLHECIQESELDLGINLFNAYALGFALAVEALSDSHPEASKFLKDYMGKRSAGLEAAFDAVRDTMEVV